MADSNQLPSMLIESLKEEKEDRARIENIEKINVSLKDKHIKLSEEQTDQLIALRDSLESNSLQTLEDKKEANSVASDTLGLLSDIRDNTEDLNFEFSSGKEGIAEKVFVFGKLFLSSFAWGFIKGIASIFKFPTLKKLFSKLVIRPLKATIFKPVINLFNYISSVFRALGDIYKKAGKGQFLKGSTLKIFGSRSIKFLTALFKGIKRGVAIVKSFGNILLKGFMFIKGGILKIMKPFKDMRTEFKDILNQTKSLSGGKGPLSGIMNTVKRIGGLLGKFKGLFRRLGFVIGRRFLFPILAVIDFYKGVKSGLNTSKFTSPVAKAIDGLLSGIGFALGGFFGSIFDLIKDGISWIADLFGFEGFSEWLDSFSLREMIERGFSDMAEFFSDLFTNFLPALYEGTKAAAIPFGKTFSQAFNERLTLGAEGYKNRQELEKSGVFDASNRFRLKGELQDELRKHKKFLEDGDTRTGFGFNREKIVAELEIELAAVDLAIQKNQERINRLNNITGAEMEATQDDTADAKATPVEVPAGVVSNMQNIDNSSSSVVKTTNMNNHIDRTSMAAFAPVLFR